jgi:hypothetical protein
MESDRHKAIKLQIADFFTNRGWDVELEAPGDGWRADVLIRKGDRAAAFEVELSRPSAKEILKRKAKYDDAGIPSMWITGSSPRSENSRPDLPYFALAKETPEEGEFVKLNDGWISLNTLLEATEEKRLVWSPATIDQENAGTIISFGFECWSCEKPFTAIRGMEKPHGVCGSLASSRYEMDDAAFREAVSKLLVEGHFTEEHGPLAIMRHGRSRFRPDGYFANHCPHCRKLQENWPLDSQLRHVLFEGDRLSQVRKVWAPTELDDFGFGDYDHNHWCVRPR